MILTSAMVEANENLPLVSRARAAPRGFDSLSGVMNVLIRNTSVIPGGGVLKHVTRPS